MEKDKLIKDAQYRKGLSISYFNATNNAIEMLKLRYQGQDMTQVPISQIMDALTASRDWLLEEHKNYYASVIANVGLFNPKDTMARLDKTKTLEELQIMWRSLSADERKNQEIVDYAKALKKKYENPQ